MTGSVAGIRRRRTVAGRRETPHLPPDRDFYGQTLLRWTGLVCYGLFFCVSVFVFFFVMPWIGLLKRLFWKIKYDEQFKRAMGKLESCVPGRGYRGVPADFWDKHNIPPPPINLRFVDDVGTSGPWIYFLLLVFSLIALLALIVV